MKLRWSRVAAALSVIAVVASATACSSDDGGDELLIYNAQHESLTKEWIDAFTEETGIKVTYRQGGDTELGNQLIAEGDASPADVFLTENSPAMAAVEDAGLFADVDAATVEQVPAEYRPSTNKWTGVAARTTVFAYNTEKLQLGELPRSIMDLQQPEWKGPLGRAAAQGGLSGDRCGDAAADGRRGHLRVADRDEDQRHPASGQHRHPARGQRR